MKYFIIFLTLMNHAFAKNDLSCLKGDAKLRELYQSGNCEGKEIHLTYDDGPDIELTPKIIKILNDKNVNATFFVSTDKLVVDSSKIGFSPFEIAKRKEILRLMIANKHQVASHGFTHTAHDLRLNFEKTKCEKILSPEESAAELKKSYELIKDAIGEENYNKQKYNLVRFPYGRGSKVSKHDLELILRYGHGSNTCPHLVEELEKTNEERFSMTYTQYVEELKKYRESGSIPLQNVYSKNYTHIGWNYDSEDSGKAKHLRGKEYRNYLLETLCSNETPRKMMALFHDNLKPQNVEVLPELIDKARCLGMKFKSYEEIQKGSYMENAGVIQRPPAIETVMKKYNKNAEINFGLDKEPAKSCPGNCKDVIRPIDKKCYSNSLKTYLAHCKGDEYICFFGKMTKKSDIENFDLYCSKEKCEGASKTTIGKEYFQCQGVDFKCINGEWKSKNEELVKQICNL